MGEKKDRFMEVIDRMTSIHKKKDADYSGDNSSLGNFRESEKLGIPAWVGAFVRLQDKYARACNLIRSSVAVVEDETLEDTLIDLANYAVIVLCLLKEERPE